MTRASDIDHFAAIHRVLRLYLDGIHEGSVPRLEKATHSDCRMVCVSGGKYANIGMDEYFDIVASRESPSALGEDRRDEVRSVSVIGDEIAVVRLACLVLGKLCEDALTLVREDGEWRIVSKVYSYRMSDG